MNKLWLGLLLLVPTALQAQQVGRANVTAAGDNETNHVYTQSVSVTVPDSTLTTQWTLWNMFANDSVGNYNAQRVQGALEIRDQNAFVRGAIGYERLYASISGDRSQPVGAISMGFKPTWTNANPVEAEIGIRYAAFDEIGQYIRADLSTTTAFIRTEAWLRQVIWTQGLVSYADMSDDNSRLAVGAFARYLQTNGVFYGFKYYYQGYRYDAGAAYWSPLAYQQLMMQLGYKVPWDNATWEGIAVVSAGQQKQDSFDPTFFGRITAEVAHKVSSTVWITGTGALSNGSAITGNPKGYQAWLFGLGGRVSL